MFICVCDLGMSGVRARFLAGAFLVRGSPIVSGFLRLLAPLIPRVARLLLDSVVGVTSRIAPDRILLTDFRNVKHEPNYE